MIATDHWATIDSAPEGVYLRTRRDGECGENICAYVRWPDGDIEWFERDGGRTTITHHSFAAPTHWRHIDG